MRTRLRSRIRRRALYAFRYRSAAHFVEFFRAWYGPTHRAFAALEADGQRELHGALVDLLTAENTHPGDALVVPGEYLEAVITKQA